MPQTNRNAELIERVPFVQAAGPEAMAPLLAASFIQVLPRGAVLFEQGDMPQMLHLVLDGRLGLQATAETQGQTMVEIFGPGEIVLAPAVVLALPYLASAVALTEVRVMMLPAVLFREALARSLPLARAMNELLARHWRLMVDQVVDLKLRSAEQRVGRYLARRLPEEAGAGSVDLAEPRGAIAARLGVTPETLSRTLAGLEAAGRIRVSARRIDIPDRDALLSAARPGTKG
jgi:CRP/FNR family transcriptional activator FtrB